MILVAGRYYTKRSNLGVPAARISEKGQFWEQVPHETAESWGTWPDIGTAERGCGQVVHETVKHWGTCGKNERKGAVLGAGTT